LLRLGTSRLGETTKGTVWDIFGRNRSL
jgi:hypothetical protein